MLVISNCCRNEIRLRDLSFQVTRKLCFDVDGVRITIFDFLVHPNQNYINRRLLQPIQAFHLQSDMDPAEPIDNNVAANEMQLKKFDTVSDEWIYHKPLSKHMTVKNGYQLYRIKQCAWYWGILISVAAGSDTVQYSRAPRLRAVPFPFVFSPPMYAMSNQ